MTPILVTSKLFRPSFGVVSLNDHSEAKEKSGFWGPLQKTLSIHVRQYSNAPSSYLYSKHPQKHPETASISYIRPIPPFQ